MSRTPPTKSITITAERAIVAEIDALSSLVNGSRNDLVVQALRQYLEANAWRMERVREGGAAAREGRVETS